jgi:hypothetical protein
MAGNQKISDGQRLQNFITATRQNITQGENITFTENAYKTINVPKSKALGKITLLLNGTCKLTHATKTTYTAKTFGKYNLLRQILLKTNTSINPVMLSGVELYLYNLTKNYKNVTDNRNCIDYATNVVSSGGSTNTFSLMLDIPLSVNERDFIGLINMQAEGLQLDLGVTFGAIKDIMTDTDITVSDISMTCIPIMETYSIPPVAEAIPAFNTLKTVVSQNTVITGTGNTTVKFSPGLTYRKMIVYMGADANNTAIALSAINDFSILLNQNDVPYSALPSYFLAGKNTKMYGGLLPAGLFVFDFANEGIPDYGVGRDLIKSKDMSELWLRVNMASYSSGYNVNVILEQVAQLGGF